MQLNEWLVGIEPSPRVVVMEPFAGTEGLAAVVLHAGKQTVLGAREEDAVSEMEKKWKRNDATHCLKELHGCILI